MNSLTAIQTSTRREITARSVSGLSAALCDTLASNKKVVKELDVLLGVLVW
jgi:hypothetical protein